MFEVEWDRFFELVTSGYGITVACAIIVGWAVCALWYLRKKVRPIQRQFEERYRSVAETNNKRDFAANFLELDEEFRTCPIIGHSWREFEETLLEPSDGDDRQWYLNAYPASNYFNRAALLGASVNLRYYNAVPNILTGLGILGTFIGLVAGIYLASHGLGSDDVDQAKQALEKLLNGASLAFITSITGLFLSILFSTIEKRWIHNFDELCSKWVRALDERLERVTPEKVALETLAQTRLQTKSLQQFTDQLVFQLAEAFEKSMENSLQPALGQVVEQLQGLREDQVKASDETLERLISEFSTTISGAAGEEMKAFASAVGQMSTGLQEQISAMSQSHERMQRSSQQAVHQLTETFRESSRQLNEELAASVRDMVGQISATVAEMTTELKRASETTTSNMNQIVERFDESVAKLRQSVADVREITTQTKYVTEGLDELIHAMRESHDQLAATAEPIRRASEQFSATAAAMGGSSDSMQQSGQLLSNTLENLAGLQEEIREAWNDYQNRFEQVDASLERVFGQLDDGLKRYADSTSTYMKELDHHASDVVRTLAGAVRELNDSIDELAELNRSGVPA